MGLVQSTSGRIADSRPSPDSPESLNSLEEDVQETVKESDDFAAAIHREAASRMGVSQGLMENIIGGGFMLVIGIIMLGFLFDLDLVSNFSGPFASQLDTVETVLGAAIVFAVLGILALAGVYAYSMFRQGR